MALLRTKALLTRPAQPQRSRVRNLLSRLAPTAALLAAACGSGGGGTGSSSTGGQPELLRVEFGRLADVYGYQVTPQGQSITLFEKDVLIGPDIEDERSTNDSKRDEEIFYDFIGSDPDTLQPRLLIPRSIESTDFQDAFAALDDEVRQIAPMVFGGNGPGRPFGVVPRNAAVRL
ncbi:MAG: hypothetical protein RL398_536, partial [Planctomycetota bacterium]